MSGTKAERFLQRLAVDASLREALVLAARGDDDQAVIDVRSLLAEAGVELSSEDFAAATSRLRARPARNVLERDEGAVDSRIGGLAGAFFLPSLPGWLPGDG